MSVQYPLNLPPIPRTGATIKQLPAFDVIATASGVANIKRTLVNPPLEYVSKIKLIGNEQIALFDDWFVKDTLNGVLRFTISLYLPVNSGAINCVCQFVSPPTYSEIGTHTNRIKEVTLSFYVYNPPHAVTNNIAGVYPNIPAPITKSVSETKTNMNIAGTTPYGETSPVGVAQGAETYSLTLLLSYGEFSVFDAWWSNIQGDGALAFSLPLLTSQGLKNMIVRPLNGWTAKCSTGDVVIGLEVELTRPITTNGLDSEINNISFTTADLTELSTQIKAVWKALKGI